MARARVDLRYIEQDFQSVIDSHRVLDEALRGQRTGPAAIPYPAEQLLERVNEHASDGLHQVGTTRMGSRPRRERGRRESEGAWSRESLRRFVERFSDDGRQTHALAVAFRSAAGGAISIRA